MNETELLKIQLEHERDARLKAESMLHEKVLQLTHLNEQLHSSNANFERQREEGDAAVQKVENRYQVLIESLKDIIYKSTTEGYFTFVNPVVKDLLGYEPEEIIGKHFTDLVVPEYREDLLSFYLNMMKQRQESTYMEFPAITKDNRVVWIGQSVHLLKENDRIVELSAVARDITQRYLNAENIRKSEEKYRKIMDNMTLGLLEVDNDQRIIRAYERFCKMVGYSEEELVGKIASDLFVAKGYEDVINTEQAKREFGTGSSYEMKLIKKDGSILWAIISGSPIFDENGKIVGSIGVHYDITERKNLEQELAQAKQIAEEARQAEKQFLANMSHEIRTPLNAIIGMTHLLFDTSPSSQQKEYLDALKTTADFLYGLISNLLDMAKIEDGKIEVKKKKFDLVGLLRATQQIFRIKLENRPINVDLVVDNRISGNYIGDDLLLNQILLNLIGNAEKFTTEGSIDISVSVKQQKEENTWLEFKVSDTGMGIPEEKLDLIFQKFEQVSLHGHKQRGTGLGLTITKQLVELQGGKISVKSQEGKGSVFTFVLPFTRAKEESIEKKETSRQTMKIGTILVAEDNAMNQKYISNLLLKWNIPYAIAPDGKKAIELASQQLFDIILMDIQMPNMDGYEAAINIRNTDNLNAKTPIIALTASAMVDQKNKALEVGMNGFISKPFTPNHLLNTIQEFVNAKNTSASDDRQDNVEKIILNRICLQELYGDDKEYAADMFQTFLTDVVPEFDTLTNLVVSDEKKKLEKLVHKLKPTLGMVGLTELEKRMFDFEEQIKQTATEEELLTIWKSIFEDINESIPVVRNELAKLLI